MTLLEQSRPGTPDDAVDGVTPSLVAEPESGAAFAALLADASSDRRPTVMRGGGTKSGWGRTPAAVGLVVSTARLGSLLVHRDGDLTATVGAGVTLARLNQTLAARGQWLPVDSAFGGTTIGGMLATNDAGPLRHRYGTPRDLLIGITLALTDGHVVKAGGVVVKNVAGYDLGKLMTGSYGSLAGIVDATFKLLPIPHASATLRVAYADPDALAADAAVLAEGQLEPTALDLRGDPSSADRPWTLLVRFASSPTAVTAQVDAARGALTGEIVMATGADEARLWRDQVDAPWTGEAVVRCSWAPSRLSEVLTLMRDLDTVCRVSLTGRAGIGAGLLCVAGPAARIADVVAGLRGEGSPVAHVAILRGSPELKAAVDVWGIAAAAPAAALKHAFDPGGILNAGRGPV